jgi:hypothetical protein
MPPKKETTTPTKEYKDVAINTPASSGVAAIQNGNAAETSTQMSSDESEFILACLIHNANGGPIPVGHPEFSSFIESMSFFRVIELTISHPHS